MTPGDNSRVPGFLKKFLDRGADDRRRDFWKHHNGTLEFDDALRAVLSLPSGPSDPEILEEWIASGLSKSQSLGLSHRGVRPKHLREFLEFGHHPSRIGLAAVRSSGQLRSIITPEVDREILRAGVDLATEDDADLLDPISRVRHDRTYGWTDAAFLVARGVGPDWLGLIQNACGTRLDRETVLDFHASRLSIDQVEEWWPTGLTVRDIKVLVEGQVSVVLWQELAGIGLTARLAVEARRTWGEESPSEWMSVLSCGFGEATGWRERLSDLRLAAGWARVVEGFDEYDLLHSVDLDLAAVVGWRGIGVTSLDDTLQHHSVWSPDECARWSSALGCDAASALNWFGTGFGLGACEEWNAAGLSVNETVHAVSAGLSVEDLIQFRQRGVETIQDIREHREMWDVSELDEWCTELKSEPVTALEWRRQLDDPREAASWIAAGQAPKDVGPYLVIGLTAEAFAKWSDLGVSRWAEIADLVVAGIGPDAFEDWSAVVGRDVARVLEWVRSGVPVDTARVVCAAVVDVDRALVWAVLPLESDVRLRLIAAGLDPSRVDGFLGLGVSDVDELITAARLWSPGDADRWMTGLSCDHATAAAWYATGVSLSEIADLVVAGIGPDAFEDWSAVVGRDVARVLEWVRSGVPLDTARPVCAAVVDVDRALVWAVLPLESDVRLRLIAAGLDPSRVDGFLGLGVSDVDELITAATLWSPEDADLWMNALSCDHATAAAWFSTGAHIDEAAASGSLPELLEWLRLSVRGADLITHVRNRMSTEEVTEFLDAGWRDLVSASHWCAAGFEPDEALVWAGIGFSISDAALAGEAGLTAREAQEWVSIGANGLIENIELGLIWGSKDEAAAWAGQLGCDIREAGEWRDVIADVAEAARWRRCSTPLLAALWLGEGVAASDAESWLVNGIVDPVEARRWADSGFAPPDAATWIAHAVDPAFARECSDEGMSCDDWARLSAGLPRGEWDRVAWAWSLERAGLASDDGIPTAMVVSGRPIDALAQIERLVLVGLSNGLDAVRVVHHGGDIDADLIPLLDDPVFVRGAGRVALTMSDRLDPELCIESIESRGDESMLKLAVIAPRARFLRVPVELGAVA